jgi:hypothetical protein
VKQIGPEFGFCDEKEARIDSFHHVSKDDRVIQRKEKNAIRFRNLFSGCLLTCTGHRRQDDEAVRKHRFNLFDEGTRSENLSHRSGVDPDGSLLRKVGKISQSLQEFFAPVFIEEASREKIGSSTQEKKARDPVIG